MSVDSSGPLQILRQDSKIEKLAKSLPPKHGTIVKLADLNTAAQKENYIALLKVSNS